MEQAALFLRNPVGAYVSGLKQCHVCGAWVRTSTTHWLKALFLQLCFKSCHKNKMDVGEGKRHYLTSGIFSFPVGWLRPQVLLLLGFSPPTPIHPWGCFDSHAILGIPGYVLGGAVQTEMSLEQKQQTRKQLWKLSQTLWGLTSQNAGLSQCWFFFSIQTL